MKINGIQINQYINGELSGEALATFETQLKTDNDLLHKVKMHNEIDTVLEQNYLDIDEKERAKEKERLQPIFDEIGKKYFKKQSNKRPIIRKLLPLTALAAAILLFILFNPLVNKLSPGELADEYFEPFVIERLMGPGKDNITESPKELLGKASQLYQNNQLNEAIAIFEKVANNSSEVYRQKANWYLALCYLKQNQSGKAKPLLEELKQSGDYKEKATTVLKQLK